ncbi:ribosomal protein S18-alanine N-acetyltransferase [Dehalogenimonas sp. THU2]|uniref:ribosomal protein S18-alanine N-acetyltransferase n=1 Tax=Dehalogenimonas sp. THU2 TaxID=3151121 RepID=UPI0032186249
MPYTVRPMCREDIVQVTAIDREAFPTMWPPMNYQRELENRLAYYIVVVENPTPSPDESPEPESVGLARRVRDWLAPGHDNHHDKIIGFAGFWIMAGESHIISLAVKRECRCRGLGQLLLLALIEEAVKRESETVTLEVRVSNYEAQRMYLKHGFIGKGVRRAYYTDNREDALIMTLDDAASPECCSRVIEARKALSLES